MKQQTRTYLGGFLGTLFAAGLAACSTGGETVGAGGGLPTSCGASTRTIDATGMNQSAVTVDAKQVTVTNATITSNSNASDPNAALASGVDSAVLVKNAGVLTLSCSTISTKGQGGTAMFATGADSAVSATDMQVTCTGDEAQGAAVSHGGRVDLNDVDITTRGSVSPALAVTTGGGKLSALGGNIRTAGIDSPGILSMGTVAVSNATITATGAEAAVIQGAGNTIELTNTKLSGATGAHDRGMLIYRSSSDNGQGGTVTMTSGSFTWSSTTGPAFLVTNATGTITMKDVVLTNHSPTLLQAAAGQWGTAGTNGGTVDFTADGEMLAGDVVADPISTVSLTLQHGTLLKGAINTAATARMMNLTIDSKSSWNVTADSVLSNLEDDKGDFSNIVDNGHSICFVNSANHSTSTTVRLAGGGTLKPCP